MTPSFPAIYRRGSWPSRRTCHRLLCTAGLASVAISLRAQSPECQILSPADGVVVTTAALPANFIRGTARAVDGPPQVMIELMRVPNVKDISSEMTWNADNWAIANQFSTASTAPPPFR